MHKAIVVLFALIIGASGCSFSLSTHGGWDSGSRPPLLASSGPGKPARRAQGEVTRDPGEPARTIGPPARVGRADPPPRVGRADPPKIQWVGPPKAQPKPQPEARPATWPDPARPGSAKPTIRWVGPANQPGATPGPRRVGRVDPVPQ